MKTREAPVDGAIVQQIVAEQIVDANDPWELMHFKERLSTYCPSQEERLLALAILDSLATEGGAMARRQLWESVKARGAFTDEEQFQNVLRLLARDHYLTTTPKGESCFKFSLIRRWWAIERGL